MKLYLLSFIKDQKVWPVFQKFQKASFTSSFETDAVLYSMCAPCLSYHSNTEDVLFACISSGWATTTGIDLLALKGY